MSKTQEYELRRTYIEKVLGTALKAKKGFESIKYAREIATDAEYIRICDVRGEAVTLNITGKGLEEVMTDVFKVAIYSVLGKHDKMTAPADIITDRAELLRLAPLFRATGL